MTQVVSLSSRTTKDEGTLRFEPKFYSMDFDRNTVTFTVEGRKYYEGWFKRFGFTLDEADSKSFVEAVMHINRLVGKLLPEDLEREIGSGRMSEQDKALWTKYLEHDYEAFAAELARVAEEPVVQPPDNVVALLSRK